MQALINKLERLKKLSLKEVIEKPTTREFIIQLNQRQIFINGERADGFNIGTYKRYTEEANRGRAFFYLGQSKTKTSGSNIFLFDTGYFFRSFKVIVASDGSFKITADDSTGKDNPLTQTYGEEILGLSSESLSELIDYCRGLLQEEVRRLLAG